MATKKIFIVGQCKDSYRTQAFVSILLSDTKLYKCYYNSFYSSWDRTFLGLFGCVIGRILKRLSDYQALISSDVVYFPAMGINMPMLKFAKLLKKNIIVEFYISLYDTHVLDRKTVFADTLEAKNLMKIDRVAQSVGRTIYLNQTEALRYSFLAGLKLEELNYEIIPLVIDERRQAELKYYNLNAEDFNLIWWGTYIPLHGLDKLLEAFLILHKQDDRYKFYIYGNNSNLSYNYIEFIKKHKLEDYLFLRDDLTFSNGLETMIIENCSLAFGCFGDSDKAKSVILNKVIEAVAMKIPVVTQHSAAFKEYFEDNKNIFYCDSTPDQIAKKIMQISKMERSYIQNCINSAFDVYLRNFSPEAFTEKIKKMLSN